MSATFFQVIQPKVRWGESDCSKMLTVDESKTSLSANQVYTCSEQKVGKNYLSVPVWSYKLLLCKYRH